MSGTRRQLVNFAEQTRVYNHLKAVTEMFQSENSGVYYLRYKKDWDDTKVGEKFGYSKFQIKEFRQANVGKESPSNTSKPHSRMAMLKKLGELEDRILTLENYVTTEVEVRTRGQGNGQ